MERLQPVRNEFLVRLYHWSDEFSRLEFETDFPIVQRIKSSNVLHFLSFARWLNTKDRFLLRSALLKRFHPWAAEALGDLLSVQEKGLLDRYSEARRADASQTDAVAANPSSKALLRRMLSQRLNATFGEPHEVAPERETWTYRSEIDCWTLQTLIDTGGRRGFGYFHSISAQHAVYLQQHISILSWMGVSSQTDWFHLSEKEYGGAADALADICALFIDNAPKLLANLSHHLPDPEVRGWQEPVTVRGHRKNGMTSVVLDTPELRNAFRGKATWEIPTSIIPETLRAGGSRFVIVQDPSFSRTSSDPLAMTPTYRHLRIEPLLC